MSIINKKISHYLFLGGLPLGLKPKAAHLHNIHDRLPGKYWHKGMYKHRIAKHGK